MIDEKTNEPRQETPSAPPVKHKRTLRSLWAQLQCSRLLRRHHFRRKTQHRMNNLSQKLRGSAMVLTVGEELYALALLPNIRWCVWAAALPPGGCGCGTASAMCCMRCRHRFPRRGPDVPGAVRPYPALLPGHRLFAGARLRCPEKAGLRRGAQGQRPLLCQRHPAQPRIAAPDGHVHPAGLYAGGVLVRLQPHHPPALCAGGAGQRPDRRLCGQRNGLQPRP